MNIAKFDTCPLPGYPEDYGLILALLQDGTREWRGELGEPTIDQICWQPYPNGHSVGTALLHIAIAEAFWVEEFSLGRTIPPQEHAQCMKGEINQFTGYWPAPPREPIAYYYGILDRIRARTLESVREFEASDTIKTSEWGTMTLRWVLSHVAQHDSYHGGQAVLLNEMASRMA